MKYKFFYLCILLLLLSVKTFSLSIQDLMNIALEYNSEISTAKINYEKQRLSLKNMNGMYSPNITLSSSTMLSKDYRWNTIPDAFTSSITYSNLLPGGTTISMEMGYAFTCMDAYDERFINKKPYISFGISQSLLPFWAQGEIDDPIKLSLEQQEEYCYYQFLYIKKKTMMALFQNYILSIISQNEIKMNENMLEIYDEQIEALRILEKAGNIAQSEIVEVENLKWSTLQNLMVVQLNHAQQIQNLKSLCGKDFDETLIGYIIDKKFENVLLEILESEPEPLERIYELKLKILETERVLEKQTSAPALSLSFQPNWTFNSIKTEDWKNSWEDFEKIQSWTFGVGINFSPLFSEIAKKDKEKYLLDYKSAENAYNSYLVQRNFVRQQYETLLKYYLQQKELICKLYDFGINELRDYKNQYETKMVSRLDFDSVKIRVENYRLSKECVELYLWLYEMLVKFEY